MRPDPRVLLADVDRAASDITRFAEGMDRETYVGDARTQAAVERKFEVIGEALNRRHRTHPEVAAHVPSLRDADYLTDDDRGPGQMLDRFEPSSALRGGTEAPPGAEPGAGGGTQSSTKPHQLGHLPRNLACLNNLAISIVRVQGRFEFLPQAHRHYARCPEQAVRHLLEPAPP